MIPEPNITCNNERLAKCLSDQCKRLYDLVHECMSGIKKNIIFNFYNLAGLNMSTFVALFAILVLLFWLKKY